MALGPPRQDLESQRDPDIYTSVDALQRLQFQARGFSFLPRQPVNSILSGQNVSRLRGRGLNFEEMRPYHLGDDIRTMDWKVTLRTGKPHVKVFNEERERNVYLLVDQRQTMFFGSTGRMKSVVAAEVAALAAWRVLASTDRIGALVFNDEQVVSLVPKRSNFQVVKVLAEIVRQNHQLASGRPGQPLSESFNNTFEKLMRVIGHDALVILISDGRGWNDKSTEYVKRIRQHNEMIICHVVDPLERQMPKLKQAVLSDGQLQVEVAAKETELFEIYQQGIQSQLAKLGQISGKFRIPVLPFETVTETRRQLCKALGC